MDTLAPIELRTEPHLIQQVASAHAPRIWGFCEPFLAKALEKGHAFDITNTSYLLAGILTDRLQLWVALQGTRIDAAVVTRFIDWDLPGARTLYVPVIGGRNMKGWHDPMLAALDRFALQNGCQDVRGEFRKGWAKSGFEIVGVMLKRKLT